MQFELLKSNIPKGQYLASKVNPQDKFNDRLIPESQSPLGKKIMKRRASFSLPRSLWFAKIRILYRSVIGQARITFQKRIQMSKNNSEFVTWFRHYRTGKIMYAKDYGYKAWPFGRRK